MAEDPLVVFEDDSLIVLNKPPGLYSSMRKDDESLDSVAVWLMNRFPQCETASEKREDGGLCHRLDKETSGLLVSAKTRESFLSMRELFQKREIKKIYRCLVEGKSPQALELSGYLYGRYRGSAKVSVSSTEQKRSSFAELSAKLIEYYEKADLSLLEVELITGFRHQIRAQLAAAGHPLIGDTLYGSEKPFPDYSVTPFPEVARDFFLHASALAFKHPENGKPLAFEVDCSVGEA